MSTGLAESDPTLQYPLSIIRMMATGCQVRLTYQPVFYAPIIPVVQTLHSSLRNSGWARSQTLYSISLLTIASRGDLDSRACVWHTCASH